MQRLRDPADWELFGSRGGQRPLLLDHNNNSKHRPPLKNTTRGTASAVPRVGEFHPSSINSMGLRQRAPAEWEGWSTDSLSIVQIDVRGIVENEPGSRSEHVARIQHDAEGTGSHT